MPMLKRDDGEIYFEDLGSGYPVLALAAGWFRSRIEMWGPRPEQPYPWLDWPSLLASNYRVIVMDQRTAGQSRTAITADQGWHTFAADQLAVMDHLGIDRFHVIGVCIGGSFVMRLCQEAPDRISAGLMLQPVGLHPDHPTHFIDGHPAWVEEKCAERPDLNREDLMSFGHNICDHDFVFSVDRAFARSCETPALIAPGDNVPHPAVIAEELADLMPNAELFPDWKSPEFADRQRDHGLAFLGQHTPK